MSSPPDPHRGEPVLRFGPPPAEARLAVITIHGRGASAEDILGLAREIQLTDLTYLAPQAAGRTWYPYSFLSPVERNEPALSSALGVIADLVEALVADGVTHDRIALMGFSQGACLSLEFAARHARRYAGVIGFSGGVIGPPDAPRDYAGAMDGTPVFLGCSDIDSHIPVERVHETAEIFRRLGAAVDERIYPRMGHAVNEEEIAAARAILSGPR